MTNFFKIKLQVENYAKKGIKNILGSEFGL